MADEVKKPIPNAVTADQMRKTTTDQAKLQKFYDNRQSESQHTIDTATDSALNEQKKHLTTAFQNNKKDLAAERKRTGKDYTAASKGTLQQISQNRNALESYANAREINTAPGSQQALQLNQVRSTARGQLYAQRTRALEENTRRQMLAKTDYQNQVAQAIKKHDYTRAAALLDDYNNQNAWRENQAKILAQYGNFDAYGLLYGNQQAKNMRDMWIATNPELAYNTGVISAQRYKAITGKDAPGVEPAGGGGGGGGDNGDWWWYTPESGYSGGSGGGGGAGGGSNSSGDGSAHWSTLTDRGLA